MKFGTMNSSTAPTAKVKASCRRKASASEPPLFIQASSLDVIVALPSMAQHQALRPYLQEGDDDNEHEHLGHRRRRAVFDERVEPADREGSAYCADQYA